MLQALMAQGWAWPRAAASAGWATPPVASVVSLPLLVLRQAPPRDTFGRNPHSAPLGLSPQTLTEAKGDPESRTFLEGQLATLQRQLKTATKDQKHELGQLIAETKTALGALA